MCERRRRSIRVPFAILLSATPKVALPSAVIDRRYRLFADNRNGNFSSMLGATMLEQEYTLPGSKLHFAVDNRDRLACAGQGHPDVRRHVIAPFRAVSEIVSVFWHQTIEKFLQVTSRRGIGIFHNDDAATGVLHKDSQCAILHSAAIDLRLHLIGDFVQSFTFGAKFELVVMDMH
jgi:hypothetical protein